MERKFVFVTNYYCCADQNNIFVRMFEVQNMYFMDRLWLYP